MKIEFTQWLQEEIERFAVDKVKERLAERYPDDKFDISIGDAEQSYRAGEISIAWTAFGLDGKRWNNEEGTETFVIRDLVREYVKE